MPGYTRRSPGRRNPGGGLAGMTQDWFQGMDIMDMAAAGGGLLAAATIPSQVIRPVAPATELTQNQKLLKLLVSAGVAAAAGMLGRNLASPSAGRAALAGGIAGTVVQAISNFTNVQIGQPSQRILLPAPGRLVGRYPAPVRESEFEGVRLQ